MSNAEQGRDFMLQHSADAGLTWKVVGPVTARGLSIASPTEDITDQSSDNVQSEMGHTGYQQGQVAVSGKVREKAGTDTGSGLVLLTYNELSAIANASTVNARRGLFQLIGTHESYEDIMLISEWAVEGDRSSIMEFSMTLVFSGEAYLHTPLP